MYYYVHVRIYVQRDLQFQASIVRSLKFFTDLLIVLDYTHAHAHMYIYVYDQTRL